MTAQVVSKTQQHAARAGMPIAPKRRREKTLNPTPTPRYRRPQSCTANARWRGEARSFTPARCAPHERSLVRQRADRADAKPALAARRQVRLRRRIAFGVAAFVIFAVLTTWAIAAIAAGSDIAVGGQITVSHGQTLWSIASDHAGAGVDVREVIAQIITLNDLPSSGVQVGQQLLLPAQ